MLKMVFWALFTLIGAVAAYDVYLSIKMRHVLHIMEENPVGRWLIALDGGDVALFMTIKMAGILVVLISLQSLFRHHRRAGMTVVVALASFQVGLFGYLTFSDPCDPEVVEAREKWPHAPSSAICAPPSTAVRVSANRCDVTLDSTPRR